MADQQHTPTAENIEELEALGVLAVRDEPLELGVEPGDVLVHATAGDGDALLLTPNEADLLARGTGGPDAPDFAGALERLGRIRTRRVVALAARPEDATPEQAAAQAWRLLTAALDGGVYSTAPAGQDLEGYVNAYLNLRTHAGNGRRALELAETAQAERRAIERRAGAVLEEAKGLGKDTFEGRLETLGVRLDELGEVVG